MLPVRQTNGFFFRLTELGLDVDSPEAIRSLGNWIASSRSLNSLDISGKSPERKIIHLFKALSCHINTRNYWEILLNRAPVYERYVFPVMPMNPTECYLFLKRFMKTVPLRKSSFGCITIFAIPCVRRDMNKTHESGKIGESIKSICRALVATKIESMSFLSPKRRPKVKFGNRAFSQFGKLLQRSKTITSFHVNCA